MAFDKDIYVIEKPEISKYKGNPILKLPAGGGFPFSFGLSKAKAILTHLAEIEKFVESDGKSIEVKGV